MFPCQSCNSSFFRYRMVGRNTEHNHCRLQALCRPKNRVPFFSGGGHGQMNTFTFLLCQCQRTSKQRLLFGAEKLLWLQFVLARVRTVKKPQVQRDYVLLVSIDLIERRAQVVKGVVI